MSPLFFVQAGYGDEVLLKNGDRLTGKIVRLVDGKLVINSDVAGEVTVELANIQTLSSDEPLTVNLKDGTGFNQKISGSGAGQSGPRNLPLVILFLSIRRFRSGKEISPPVSLRHTATQQPRV